MKKITFLKTLLVAVGLLAGTSAWAGDKTVVKYSFDDATTPSLTAGSNSTFDYARTSVISDTKFLNIWGANNSTGTSTISLGSTDLSAETWTLTFYWAGYSGCNKKAGATVLKAGDTELFKIADAADWGSTMTLTYSGGSTTVNCYPCNKASRISANTGDALNTTAYWYLFTIVGSDEGVKLSVKLAGGEKTVVLDEQVIAAANVNPTSIVMNPGSCGSVAIDELSLSYYVEGEVIQTPVAVYTNVDGINRTITATCDTEGADVYYSLDNSTWTKGAAVTVDASGDVYFKGMKGTSESEVLTFAAEAGTEITLNTPVINRTSNTEVTISVDNSKLLLSPTATIFYEYGSESGSFTGSKTLTVAADAVITAYAAATGYANSAVAERAVALFPTTMETIENTLTKTSGWSANTFSDDTKTVSERDYAALLLDDVQWGKNVYLQKSGAWGLRASGNWYINSNTENSWLLFPDMKAGDIIVVDVTYPAADMVNATYSKYAYGTKHAYEVTADGDVELAFMKINASTMDYLYGVYAYRPVTAVSATIGATGYASFSSDYALDFSGVTELTAWKATACDGTKVTLEQVTGTVAAKTGLILKGASAEIPVVASGDAATGNLLQAVSDDMKVTKSATGTNYVLAKQSGNVVFAPITSDENAASVNKGQAFLYVAADVEAPYLQLVFADSETTGINDVISKTADVRCGVYNLNGQRVAKPTKGLYIVNGKKVIVK